MNALPFVGSNAALNVMRDLMVKRYVDQTTIDMWIIAFAFIPQPDRNTINILSPLLELRQLSETQFILSYSATIYAFCSNQGVQRCVNVEQVTRFLSYLEQKIEKGCAPRTHSSSTNKEVRFKINKVRGTFRLFSFPFFTFDFTDIRGVESDRKYGFRDGEIVKIIERMYRRRGRISADGDPRSEYRCPS